MASRRPEISFRENGDYENPSCAVCTYKRSITAKRHCACNYIPGIAKYLDMGDLSCLIALRKLIVVAGAQDNVFFIDGVREAYSTIEKV